MRAPRGRLSHRNDRVRDGTYPQSEGGANQDARTRRGGMAVDRLDARGRRTAVDVLVQALTMPRTTVSYSDFLGRVGRGDVRQVTLQGDAASGTLIPKSFKSRRKTVVLTILRIEEPAAREWR